MRLLWNPWRGIPKAYRIFVAMLALPALKPTPEEKHYQTSGDVSGVRAILQATLGSTSEGTWAGWTVVSRQVWHSAYATVSSQRDHVETEGDCAAVETMGECSDVSQGSKEGTKGGSAENRQDAEDKDGENAIVRQQRHHGRQGHTSLLRGDDS